MNNQIVEGGKIKLIIGPMFSGKSTELINTVKRYKYKNKKTVLVKYDMDNRYSDSDHVITHDNLASPAIRCSLLRNVLDTLLEYDVIGIDEGQFYSDLVEVCHELVISGKLIMVSALSGNFKQEPFDNIARLISRADKIKFKKAICFFCQESAHFSLRTIASEEELLIGASDKYRPACRVCYFKNLCQSA